MFDSTSAAKHVLAELKVTHVKNCAASLPKARKGQWSQKRRSAQLKPHNLNVRYLEELPDLQLTEDPGQAALPLPALVPFPPLCDFADQSTIRPTSTLRALTASAKELSNRVQPIKTLSEQMVAEEPKNKGCYTKYNGWTLFWKTRERDAITNPGETKKGKRHRILKAAQDEWNVSWFMWVHKTTLFILTYAIYYYYIYIIPPKPRTNSQKD